MKFQFETILRINQNKEDLLLKELGTINAHLQKQQDRKHFMENASQQSKTELNGKLREGIDPNTLLLYNNFFWGIKIQTQRQQEIVSEIHSHLDAKRKEVVEAGKKRRIMEILKERDLAKFRKLQLKQENLMMDEVSSNIWRMNQ